MLSTSSRPRYTSPFPSFRNVERAFADLATLATAPSLRHAAFGPTLEGAWVDDAYQLSVDLPGVPADAVAVSVAGRTLTIDVTTDNDSWTEQLRLPRTLDTEQVTASHVDGRLTITVAKAAEPEARLIAIDTSRPEAALPASAGEPEPAEATATE